MESIIQEDKKCFICDRMSPNLVKKSEYPNWIEKHHIFGGANRKLSEKYGLFLYLCKTHHDEVHKDNTLREVVQNVGQVFFETEYPGFDFYGIFRGRYRVADIYRSLDK